MKLSENNTKEFKAELPAIALKKKKNKKLNISTPKLKLVNKSSGDIKWQSKLYWLKVAAAESASAGKPSAQHR